VLPADPRRDAPQPARRDGGAALGSALAELLGVHDQADVHTRASAALALLPAVAAAAAEIGGYGVEPEARSRYSSM
jgi:hypothetical protein